MTSVQCDKAGCLLTLHLDELLCYFGRDVHSTLIVLVCSCRVASSAMVTCCLQILSSSPASSPIHGFCPVASALAVTAGPLRRQLTCGAQTPPPSS